MAVTSRPTPTEDYACNRDESRDRGTRFSGDSLLRQYGFVIESRPAAGPVLWRRQGRSYTDAEARSVALAMRRRDLKALETGR